MKYRVVSLFLKVQIIFLLFLTSNFLLIDGTSNKIEFYQKQNKIQQASDLELRLSFNEATSGQPEIVDSSTNSFTVTESWIGSSGMNETSYNVNASSSVHIINDTSFSIPHSTLIQPVSQEFNFSISFWLNIVDMPNNTNRYVFRKQNAFAGRLFNDSLSGFELKFQWRFFITDQSLSMMSNTVFNLNQWYFIVGLHNGTHSELWIDGALDNTAEVAPATMGSPSSNTFYVGSWLVVEDKEIYLDDFWFFSDWLNSSYINFLYENSPALDQSEIIVIPPTVPVNTAVDSGIDVRLSPITTIFALIFVAVLPLLVLLWVINKFLAALGYEGSFAEIFTILFKKDEDF